MDYKNKAKDMKNINNLSNNLDILQVLFFVFSERASQRLGRRNGEHVRAPVEVLLSCEGVISRVLAKHVVVVIPREHSCPVVCAQRGG